VAPNAVDRQFYMYFSIIAGLPKIFINLGSFSSGIYIGCVVAETFRPNCLMRLTALAEGLCAIEDRQYSSQMEKEENQA